jgi:hypothetical protein
MHIDCVSQTDKAGYLFLKTKIDLQILSKTPGNTQRFYNCTLCTLILHVLGWYLDMHVLIGPGKEDTRA